MMISRELSNKIKIVNLFSILMVVLIHTYNLKDDFLNPSTLVEEGLHPSSFIQYFISNGFARFAVPMFFIISGYLFFINLEPTAKGFGQKILKRFRTVYLVFLLWAALSLIFTIVFQAWGVTREAAIGGNDRIEVVLTPLAATLYNYFLNPAGEQFWFLRHLFRLAVISPIIYLCIKRLYFITLPIMAVIWFFELQYMSGGVYWMSNEAILFFSLGGFFAVHNVDLNWKPKKVIVDTCFVLLIILLAIKTYFALKGQDIGLCPIYKICVILSIFEVWFGYDYYIAPLKIKDTLLKLAHYSFFIYLCHEPLQGLIRYSLRGGMGEVSLNRLLVSYVLSSIVAVFICFVLGMLLQNYLPTVFNIITGGRGRKNKAKGVISNAQA